MKQTLMFKLRLCAIRNNVVYVPNLKCASIFFGRNFLDNFKWDPIQYEDIDWENQVVFSHILEPIKRRVKGQAEYVQWMQLTDKFINDPILQVALHNALCTDLHVATYHHTFEDKLHKINFLPLLDDQMANIAATNEWLSQHGITVGEWDFAFEHRSTPKTKAVASIIQRMHDDPDYLIGLFREICWYNIYNDIRDHHWPPCPRIEDFDTLPLEIRQEFVDANLETIKIDRNLQKLTVLKAFDEIPRSHAWDWYYRNDIDFYNNIVNQTVDQKIGNAV